MKNWDGIILICILLFTFQTTSRLAAQDAVVSPSDSAAQQKPEPAEPLLELPEVLIIGQDAYHRLTKEKKSLTPETPQAIALPDRYEAAAVAPQKRLAAVETSFPRVYALLQGGSSYYFYGLAGYHHLFERGEVIGNAAFQRGNGHYRNSRTGEGGVRIQGNYQLTEKTHLVSAADYERWGYGLQSTGYYRTDAERNGGHGGFRASLDYQHTQTLTGRVNVEFGGMALQSDTANIRVERSSDFFSRLGAGAKFRRGRLILEAHAAYMHESYDHENRTQLLDLGDLMFCAASSFGKAATATLGVKLTSFSADSASGSRIAPVASIVIVPNERFAASLKIDGGLTPVTMTDYRRENPFIAHSATIRPQEDKLRLQGDWQLAVSGALMIQGGFERRLAAALPAFEADSANGLLNLSWLDNVEMTSTRVGLRAKFGRTGEASVLFIDYSDDLDHTSAVGSNIPYLPDYSLPFEVTVGLPAGVRLNASAELIGRRRVTMQSRETLAPRFRMNVRLSKPIAGVAEAFVDCRNLFDDRSQQWQGYREPGLIASIGLIYRR
ncbi:MAG: hypothetical protein ONB12_10520 [candidate division KSB1 bacterium]|nr:hypothetical protein [candidate division KSB1 bacterium]